MKLNVKDDDYYIDHGPASPEGEATVRWSKYPFVAKYSEMSFKFWTQSMLKIYGTFLYTILSNWRKK